MPRAAPSPDPLYGVFADGGWIEPLDQALVAQGVEAGLFGDARPVLLGRYRLQARVGQGGGGVVYRGFDPELERPVAIKLFRAGGDDTELARLRHEGRAIATLHGPDIVEVYDVLEVGRGVAVVMEWIDGTPLDTWLTTPRTPRQILAAFTGAGRALSAVHRAGWVHRDFKPANVMMTRDDEPRLVDFGLASPTRSSASWRGTVGRDTDDTDRLTRAGAAPGTPAYMAPEARVGARQDAACDQYAFCVSLFEALYGRLPSRESVELPRLPKVPRSVRRALARGLSSDPLGRYPTMAALLTAMHPGRRTRWIGVSIAAGVAAAAVAAIPSPETGPCAEGPPSLDSRWPSVREALVGRQAPHHATAQLDAALTDYAARWQATADQACRNREVALARVRCLEVRRDAFVSFVDMLETADPRALQAAVTGVERLGTPEHCAAVRMPGLEEWMPERTEDTLVAVALRQRLHDAEALQYAARYDEALAAFEAVAADAEAAGLVPIAVLAHADRASALVHGGQVERGVEVLTVAYALARQHGFDTEASRMASDLTFSVGYMLGDYEGGVTWGRHAQALIDRLGLEGDVQARLDGHLGSVEALAGRYDRAEQHHRRAMAINRRLVEAGDEGMGLGSSLNNLGNLMVLQHRYDEAMSLHREALEVRLQWLGPTHPHVAVSKCSIAAIHMGRGEWAAARVELEEALEIWEAAVGPQHRDLVHPLNNLASVAQKQGRFTEAEALADRSLQLAEARYGADDPRLAMTHQIRGQVLADQGRAEEALEALFKARRMTEAALGPDHDDLALVHFAIGRVYFETERWAEALRYNQLASEHWSDTGRVHPDRNAADYRIAAALVQLSRVEEATTVLRILDARLGPDAAEARAEVQRLLRRVSATRR